MKLHMNSVSKREKSIRKGQIAFLIGAFFAATMPVNTAFAEEPVEVRINEGGSNNIVSDPSGFVNGDNFSITRSSTAPLSGNVWVIGDSSCVGNEGYCYIRMLDISGGDAETVSDNTITICNARLKEVYGGRAIGVALATGNKVILSADSNHGGIMIEHNDGEGGDVYGGHSQSGSVRQNHVEMYSGTVGQNVYGGRTGGDERNKRDGEDRGQATNNTVEMHGGTVSGNVYGGYASEYGNAEENSVAVYASSDGVEVQNLFGGYIANGNATKNTVNVLEGTINGDIYGGQAGNGNAIANRVTIGNPTIRGIVYGGHVSTDGDATGNKVAINGAMTVDTTVYGGYSVNGNVGSNEVAMDNGWINASAIGGEAHGEGKNATNNKVAVTESGYARVLVGGQAVNGNATGNTATLDIFSSNAVQDVYGGYAKKGNADGNFATISKGNLTGNVVGGYSEEGDANGNTVTVSGGTLTSVYGGYANQYVAVDGLTKAGSAGNNTVTIKAGTVDKVFGGSGDTGENNTINLHSHVGEVTGVNFLVDGVATNNTINWYAGNIEGKLYAYDGMTSRTPDAHQNNNLNVYGNGMTVGDKIAGFSNINFYLGGTDEHPTPQKLQDGDTLITAETYGTADLTLPRVVGIRPDGVEDDTFTVKLLEANAWQVFGEEEISIPTGMRLARTGDQLRQIEYGAEKSSKLTISATVYAVDDKKYTIDADAGCDPYVTVEGTGDDTIYYQGVTTNGSGNTWEIGETGEVNLEDQTIYGGYGMRAEDAKAKILAQLDGSADGLEITGTEDASGNTVTFHQGSVGNLYGGYTAVGSARENEVDFKDGVADMIYGGYADDGEVAENKVTIRHVANRRSLWKVCGGCAIKGNATDNTLTVLGGAIFGDSYGGYTQAGDATGNAVVVNIAEKVDGNDGDAYVGQVSGGYTRSGKAEGNRVQVLSGSVKGEVGGGVSWVGDIARNTVTITGGTLEENVFGGRGITRNDTSAAMIENAVTIAGGTLQKNVYGAQTWSGAATKNTVTVTGGTVAGDIYGADATTSATENEVKIEGGTVAGDIYGAAANVVQDNKVHLYADAKSVTLAQTVGADAIVENNTLNWYAGKIVDAIRGYAMKDGSSLQYAKNNVINVYGSGLTVKEIAGVNEINFHIGGYGGVPATNATIVNVTDAFNVAENGTTVAVKSIPVGDWTKEDAFVLLAAPGNLDKVDLASSVTVDEGVLITRTVYQTKSEDGKSIVMTFVDPKAPTPGDDDDKPTPTPGGDDDKPAPGKLKEKSKSLAETSTLATAVITQISDAVASQGIANAKVAVSQDASGGKSMAPYTYVVGGVMRYHTGSYVDSKDYGVGVGFAKRIENKNGSLLFGPVVSYGYSNYDSYLDDGTHAGGNAKALGVSLVAKQENKDGMYYEASLGGGRIRSRYDSADIATSYETKATYYSFHFGIGKVHKLSEKCSIDMYGKYMFSRQNGTDATLTSGETLAFDAVTSHRMRVGARFENEYRKNSAVYCGIAWEHEFGGDARATYRGESTPSPSLKGSSALLEIGWKAKASKASNLNADLYLNGWLGKKEGISFGANLIWEL